MRNILHTLTLAFAIAAIGFLTGPVFAGTVHLGWHSVGQIEMACGDAAGGQMNYGNGTYGCTTSKGKVQCDSNDCVGTCSNCSDRVVRTGGEREPLQTVLRGRAVAR